MSAERIVSLVPSLTEAIEATRPGRLVGATDWCVHPADLDVVRIGGTKNPRVEEIVALRPDIVIANVEENRSSDLEVMQSRGLSVWITDPETLADAFVSLDEMLRLGCGFDRPAWLDQAEAVWLAEYEGPRRSAVIPIWRRPWMVLGRSTFAGDVLARLGVDNLLGDHADRYPQVSLEDLRDTKPELVVLPDEPYAFGWEDGPDAVADWDVPVACVSGRHLTWYGPSLVEARDVLTQQLGKARRN